MKKEEIEALGFCCEKEGKYLRITNIYDYADYPNWLHEQQAKPRKDLFNPKEVLYDQNRSHNAGL